MNFLSPKWRKKHRSPSISCVRRFSQHSTTWNGMALLQLCKYVKRLFCHPIRHFCGPSAGRTAVSPVKKSATVFTSSRMTCTRNFIRPFSHFGLLHTSVSWRRRGTTKAVRGQMTSGIQRILCLYRRLIVFLLGFYKRRTTN